MIERALTGTRMVAMQLTTDEGAFICNMHESDITKMAVREEGTFVIMHYAIRLDAMIEGQYEIHKTKVIDASTVDSYQEFHKKTRYMSRKA
jgi:hypothetical protein